MVALKVSDIDSTRMVLRVEQGKGRKDRYAMLSPVLLEHLRAWWRVAHTQRLMLKGGWLFPEQNPINHMGTRQLSRACHAAALDAQIDKRVIQVLLGHKKLETTAIYASVATKLLREVISPLEILKLST